MRRQCAQARVIGRGDSGAYTASGQENLLSITELISEISQCRRTVANFFYLEVVAGCEGVQDPLRSPVAHRVIGLCENNRVEIK